MILQGKAKDDFEKWFDNEYPELSCEYNGNFNMPISSYNALIIEWFDTVSIYIKISAIKMFYENVLFKGKLENNCEVIESSDVWFKTRSEATAKAVEKAVEIYNLTK